jgi:methionine sulfoxide reductase heme-binding subunit
VSDIVEAVYKRPFITVGLIGFAVMMPPRDHIDEKVDLPAGGPAVAIPQADVCQCHSGVVHYLWLVKADTERPLIYGALLSILLGYKLFVSLAVRRPTSLPTFF